MNSLMGLALNLDPPDCCLLSSKDYRCEPPAPSTFNFLLLSKRVAQVVEYLPNKCRVLSSTTVSSPQKVLYYPDSSCLFVFLFEALSKTTGNCYVA
jgi:hypothetical protein